MSRTTVVLLALIGVGLVWSWAESKAARSPSAENQATDAPKPKLLNLSYQFSEGWLMEHDFYVTNTSGEDLTEVRLSFRFLGEDAKPIIQRYWAEWPLGQKHTISFPVDDVKNVQVIMVDGRADQGVIEAQLTRSK